MVSNGVTRVAETAGAPAGSVCAVVVTFNRKALLRECLNGLLAQTRPPDRIVIIDNASTDGTGELLAAEFPQLAYVKLPLNVGGAGGFRAGFQWAYAAGYDWIWVMDDDVEPVPGALAAMLEYRHISPFIHSRREFQGRSVPWEGVWDMSLLERRCFTTDISFDNGRDWVAVNSACFEGALVHREVIDKIGLPDERFFMAGDDTVYGYLASLHANVIYVNTVGFRRKLPQKNPANEKLYLKFRNRFLLYEHLKTAGVPLSRSAFWLQTLLSISWFLRDPQLKFLPTARWIAAGLRDGWRQRFGRPAWLEPVRERRTPCPSSTSVSSISGSSELPRKI